MGMFTSGAAPQRGQIASGAATGLFTSGA
ncbi:hypothetical protein SAMN04487993_102867 [Salipiger marinus]|uniref:Uncharacterized protein n=1 Tax=Salipiger marinus TaxID=555512 RepID=A0A1G8T9L5_9RHOB|nr:hypothetical protein SAMN04487993_102867 [Salipiger marinus]